MKQNVHTWLRSARDHALVIEREIQDVSFIDYESNEMFQFGIERLFEIVGEALRRVKSESPELFELHPELNEWIAMRNFIIHQYDGLDHFIVWQNAKEDVRTLLNTLDVILSD